MPTSRKILRYGVLGFPLAFCGLPIYVHVPKFYADVGHVDLETLGTLLLLLRLSDAFLDPIIGKLSDKAHAFSTVIMAAAIPVLILSYFALFNPSAWGARHGAVWLGVCLVFVYVSFSTIMINYYARGVELAESYDDQTRFAFAREGFFLLGVLLASLLPTLLQSILSFRAAYTVFGTLLAPFLIIGAFITLKGTKPKGEHADSQGFALKSVLRIPNVRWTLGVGFLNALPAAITSSLFLFYTSDVLKEARYAGPLLALYFLSAALGMPLWTKLSFRIGKRYTLMIAMILAVLCFLGTATLGAGDLTSFAIICFLSGMTLGADSMLLPALLADALSENKRMAATGFGLWNFTNKMTLAVGAGTVLPALGLAGYYPDAVNSGEALGALSFCYAVAPCLLKLLAIASLHFSPLDRAKRTRRENKVGA